MATLGTGNPQELINSHTHTKKKHKNRINRYILNIINATPKIIDVTKHIFERDNVKKKTIKSS